MSISAWCLRSDSAVVTTSSRQLGRCWKSPSGRIHFQSMRPAFRFVAIEQRGVRFAVKHGRDLPGQVLRILNAQIHAKAAARRGLMRGVADEEYVAAAEAVRHHGRAVPEVDAEDFHGKVGGADGPANQLDASLRRQVLLGETVGAQAVNQKTPAIRAVHRKKRRPKLRLLDQIERGRPVFDPRPQIRTKVHVHRIVDVLFASPADSEFLPNETSRSVGRQDVACAERHDLAAHLVLQGASQAAAFVPQVAQLGIEPDAIGGQGFGVTAQHRLQKILRTAAVGDR